MAFHSDISSDAVRIDCGQARPAPASGDAVGKRRRPPKLYRIGEVVDYAGVSRQTIHNYTIMGLIRESGWTRGGHRLYDESVFERLDRIAAMRAQNRSINEIMEQLGATGPGGT